MWTVASQPTNRSDDSFDAPEVSELGLFIPGLSSSMFLATLLAYLLWKSAAIGNPFTPTVNLSATDHDINSSFDDHFEYVFVDDGKYIKSINLAIDMDHASRLGNWDDVEKCINLRVSPGTKVVCRAYAARQYQLVSDIFDRKEELHFEPDLYIVLSNRSCKPLVDKMIAENHIKCIDGKLLNMACRYGHLSLVRYILELKELQPSKSHLDLAILSGNYHLVSYFVDVYNMTPRDDALEIACYSRNIFLLRYLQERFGDVFDYPSLEAVIYDAQVLRYFVQEKDYPLSQFMFKQTAFYGYFDSFDFLEKYYSFEADPASLDYACFSGNLHFVKYLVEKRNIEPNLFNLDSAAINGQLKIVKYLVNERNVTHDHFVENMAEKSRNRYLVQFLKTKKRRVYHWFYFWEFYWFRRWFHSNLLKRLSVSFKDHKAQKKRLLIA